MNRTLAILASLSVAQTAAATPLTGDVDAPASFFGLQLPDGRVAERPGRLQGRVPDGTRAAWQRFRDRNGLWHATWDAHTGVANRVYGSFVPAPGAVRDPRAAQRAAEALLFPHLDLLAPGSRPADFELVTNHLSDDGTYRTLGYRQSFRGLEVRGGHINVRIKNDRIFVLGSDALPVSRISIEVPDTTAAASLLRSRAADWIRSTRATDVQITEPLEGPFVLPIRENGTIRAEVVIRVHLKALDRVEEWDVFLRARDGARVAREQTLLFAGGDLRFESPNRWPGNGRVEDPAPFATVRLSGDFGETTETTDGFGALSWPGAAPATVELPAVNIFGIGSGLSGPRVQVANQSGATTASVELDPDGIAVVDRGSSETVDAVLNAFLANDVARERALQIESNQPWLNQPVTSFVNRTNGACNAFSNRLQTFFFRRARISSGATCENTALLDDVVYHEFGHSMHGQMLLNGVGNFTSDHSEGLSDYFAATIVDDSGMGRGFFQNSAALRELDPPAPNTWTRLRDDPVQHTRGLTYGGAMWDLRTALASKYPEDGVLRTDRLMFAALQRASSITNTFIEVLAANDDDGNLGNGTPDFCEIQAAFSVHGLAIGTPYALDIGAVEQDGAQVSLRVSASDISCEDAPPTEDLPTVRVTWSAPETGARGEFDLQRIPEMDRFAGTVPQDAVPPGTLVQYQVVIIRGDGSREVRPDADHDPVFRTLVGDFEEVFCTDFERDPFGQDGFTTRVLAGSNLTSFADDWHWGEIESPAPEDPRNAFSPSRVIGNDLGGDAGNGNRFNGRYRGGVTNRLVLPSFDVSGYEKVFLTYRRWLNVWDRRIDQATVFSNDEAVFENVAGAGNQPFSHFDGSWRFEVLNLTDTIDTAGDTQIEFELEAASREAGSQFEGFPTAGGWTLDDLCVLGFRPAVCGDGIVEQREICDDGNTEDDDGCQADCTPTPRVCGNGLVQEGEVCDDGNLQGGDGCEADCTPTPLVCGNGLVQEGEACDDGNTIDGDGCESDCTPTPVCGNGQVEDGESCDDGNTTSGDGCEADCTPTPVCGNGQVESGETCDDGNTTDGDGCQADCTPTPEPPSMDPEPDDVEPLPLNDSGCTHSGAGGSAPWLGLGGLWILMGWRRRRTG